MKSLPQTLILTVFHAVETSVPHKDVSTGILIVGQDSGSLFFKWSPYSFNKDYFHSNSILDNNTNSNSNSSNKINSTQSYSNIFNSTNNGLNIIQQKILGKSCTQRSPKTYVHQIYLAAPQIQKIILTTMPNSADLLISTLHPPEMHQFRFTVSCNQYSLQLLQLLAINSTLSEGLIISMDFWRATAFNNANTFPTFSNMQRVYDISCENGRFIVPYIPIASLASIPAIDKLQSTEIAAKFKIDGLQFTQFPMTVEDYNKVVGSSIKISDIRFQAARKGIDYKLRGILWPQLLDILPFEKDVSKYLKIREIEYNNLKKQWQLLSSYQLNKRPELRSAFQTIRMDVRRTSMPNENLEHEETKIKRVMTNILKTYSLYNYNVRYTQGLNDILLPFILVLRDSYEEYYESLSFWCFASFLEKIKSALIDNNMDTAMQTDLPMIYSLIETNDQKCSSFLKDCNMEDLNFLVSSYMLSFRRSFYEEDLERFWDTLLASSDPHLFILCFAASLIIFSFPSFQKIKNCSTPHILPLCDKIFSQQPIGSVVGVALTIFTEKSKEINIKKGNEKPSSPISQFETDYFIPSLLDETKECINAKLFV
ncbi:TBC domain containing protein [Tritrichomonas foetus]|uniref:TBC domain containing protein n=1 Tax=Tritrichomonas foetus TaxID=1144522 RepID=A0A1J4KM48_9EUKA|nr:TBC domain containing protein [Tritrichomonas foetus]|eukprot:OHT12008.1 TBC domain containing protein [Tritrichomonas foetus]